MTEATKYIYTKSQKEQMNISKKKLIIITAVVAAIGIPCTLFLSNNGRMGGGIMFFFLIWFGLVRFFDDSKEM